MKKYKLSEVFAKLEENSKLEFEFKDDWDRTFKFCVEETNPNEKYFAFKTYSASGELHEADVPIGRFNGNCCTNFLWTLVQQPVSFIDAVKSTKAVRVEHEFITNLQPSQSDEWFFKDLLEGIFFDIDNLIYYISEYADAEPLRDVLLNGKWYIEED